MFDVARIPIWILLDHRVASTQRACYPFEHRPLSRSQTVCTLVLLCTSNGIHQRATQPPVPKTIRHLAQAADFPFVILLGLQIYLLSSCSSSRFTFCLSSCSGFRFAARHLAQAPDLPRSLELHRAYDERLPTLEHELQISNYMKLPSRAPCRQQTSNHSSDEPHVANGFRTARLARPPPP